MKQVSLEHGRCLICTEPVHFSTLCFLPQTWQGGARISRNIQDEAHSQCVLVPRNGQSCLQRSLGGTPGLGSHHKIREAPAELCPSPGPEYVRSRQRRGGCDHLCIHCCPDHHRLWRGHRALCPHHGRRGPGCSDAHWQSQRRT